LEDLPDYNKIQFPAMPQVPLEKVCPDATQDAINLLEKFLVYPSGKRVSAGAALLNEYFFVSPLPAHHLELDIPSRQPLNEKKFDVDAPLEFISC
jgi:cell cycle related kinase